MTRRGYGILVPIVVVWLAIGLLAAGQRHYFSNSSETCAKASTIAVTVIAGPLNYLGLNPKLNCSLPQPSK
ncbi:hypothetical protein SAMN05444157_3843 [Frankineae bacterium MT45]|nr:hypothetical protein SAMN05444157_3843 [Frankineae bacterium MT45]